MPIIDQRSRTFGLVLVFIKQFVSSFLPLRRNARHKDGAAAVLKISNDVGTGPVFVLEQRATHVSTETK